MKKLLAVTIMILFISVSVIPSTGDIVEDVSVYNRMLDAVYSSEELLSCCHLAYIYAETSDCWLYEFILNDPGNLTCTCDGENVSLGCGTWTNNGTIIALEYNTGLVEINPETCEVEEIGGGWGLNGLSMDPTIGKLYGASSTGSTGGLWLINLENGEQEYIGDFVNTVWMIGIAFDGDGNLYGWDISPDRLYKIDKETGYAQVVGPLGINICYYSDGHFCMEDDILYLTATTNTPYNGSFLYECDEDIGNCTLVGPFEGNATATMLAIPYDLSSIPPVTTISFDPPEPDGCNGWYVSNVTVTLNATDQDGVNATYYRINNGTWETYTEPFVISEDGDDILIEYYSVDIDGNIEDVKSSELDIDQTPPEISFEWSIFEDGEIIYIKFSIGGFDATGGMNRIEFFINDELHEIVIGIGPIYEFTIQWSDILKTCTLKFAPYDDAGNKVIVKLESIKVFLFGRIENFTIVGDIFIFNAVRLRVIQFSPFSFNTYVSGEKIALLEPRLKIVTNRFVFGFFIMLFGKVTVSYNYSRELA